MNDAKRNPAFHNHTKCHFYIYVVQLQGGILLMRALGFSSYTDRQGARRHILNGGRQVSDEDIRDLKRYRFVDKCIDCFMSGCPVLTGWLVG